MNLENVLDLVEEFSQTTHGSSDYGKETTYVMGRTREQYAPLKFLSKKVEPLAAVEDLPQEGFVYASYEQGDSSEFKGWYKSQFGKSLTSKFARQVKILYHPDQPTIFQVLEQINKGYEVLKESQVLINGKNLPVQLGEWYSKCIFGLRQAKSTSQRGFDFELADKRVEVRVHWSDSVSVKGIKVKKTMVNLCEYVILIYISSSFMIRDICFLDSEFVMRKFSEKGHTIFLKDGEVAPYFFSKSNKHYDKIINKTALLKFSSPTLAMKLDDRLS